MVQSVKLLQTNMSFFNPVIELPSKDKKCPPHPWEKIIKNAYTGTYKYAHNSAKNPVYPPPKKGRVPSVNRVKFTVVGTRTCKEFVYCKKLLNGLHKYRWRHFDAPILTGVSSVEWPNIWNELKIKYGGELYCLQSPVAVFADGEFLGGVKELKELIESKYIYYLRPDYSVETIKQFTNYMDATGRPCAHLDFVIDGKHVGSMVFMLYADIVPRTCDNFLRRCYEKKGGYSGTPVHRIVRDGWIQCGGYGLKETDLDCENFIVPPDTRGVIAMANDGRHVDCSTQFFILLQPQDWMAFKYVAFGQLVIGENTLNCIEQVPIWYESPKKDVRISNASILNLRCEDITVNKEVNKYIEGHTEDLIAIGEIFYELLLEKVFLEIQFRSLQRIQNEMIVGAEGEGDITKEDIAKNLHTTERFMRKKEEIEKQIEKSQTDRSAKTTPAVTVAGRSQSNVPATVDKGENNDFDVEEYEYVPEEYLYQQAVSAYHHSESDIKLERPFYIPLTDVPYPGEVSSEFDLKRLLRGQYCYEGDLDRDLGKAKKKPDEDRLIYHSEILEELFEVKSPDLESSESQDSLDSDEAKELKKYLDDAADYVSFSGRVIKNLAQSGKRNLFDSESKKTDIVPDEAMRKYRVAEYELRRGREKKVSITLPEAVEASELRREIQRRQTGFVRPEDLCRLRQFERSDEDYGDDDDAELDDYLPYTRQVSIQHPHSLTSYKKLIAKPSIRPDEDINIKTKISHFGDHGFQGTQDKSLQSEAAMQEMRKKKESQAAGVAWKLGSDIHTTRMSEFASEGRRMSVLGKLMDDVIVDQGPGPTLKDYQPYSERENKTLFLITFSPEKHRSLKQGSDESREMYLARRHSIRTEGQKPIDQILLLQHGKRVYRKISTDYVKTIDHIEQKTETSLRSLEYAKLRPAMSVKAYQKKNKEYREKLAKESISNQYVDNKAAKESMSNAAKESMSNATNESMSNAAKSSMSNAAKSSMSNAAKSSMSNATKSSMSNAAKSSMSNAAKKSMSNAVKKSMSNAAKESMSNKDMDNKAAK